MEQVELDLHAESVLHKVPVKGLVEDHRADLVYHAEPFKTSASSDLLGSGTSVTSRD